ncbi:hypothetical protein Pta02_62020 [Planobispora takensis]|uniref:Uncharacterized protein n=1 Tax=Planobispora takensis TaxID=1367882 RepID=A0A8J3WVQ2_9ACTN|nr:hypothetical protein Pta02_62020 [Planobispora takensis]
MRPAPYRPEHWNRHLPRPCPRLPCRRRPHGGDFAAALDQDAVGYALTSSEIASDAQAGTLLTKAVSTRRCDKE